MKLAYYTLRCTTSSMFARVLNAETLYEMIREAESTTEAVAQHDAAGARALLLQV